MLQFISALYSEHNEKIDVIDFRDASADRREKKNHP